MGSLCSSEIWPSRVNKVFALLIFQTLSQKYCWQSPFSPQMVPPKMQLTQKLSSQETTITNLVLRVVDIPLTEASDSQKIAAWHMTPTEVRPRLLYNHSQVIQTNKKWRAIKDANSIKYFAGKSQQTYCAVSSRSGSHSGISAQSWSLQGWARSEHQLLSFYDYNVLMEGSSRCWFRSPGNWL